MATAEELRRLREEQSIFSALYDMARQQQSELAAEGRRPVFGGLLSKEPVYGTDTLRYEGIGNMLAGLLSPAAKAVDAPISAYRGTIPQEDMINEALGVGGLAMAGGGAVGVPRGAVGANAAANASKSAGVLTTAASEAQDMAKRILELRAEGRASEVTDEMMAQADPQYMFANTPLPMDEASRMARAEAAGFEGDLFHGTDADIIALDKEKFGLGENLLGKGFYTTGNPKRANIYVPIGTPKLPKGVFQTGNSDFTEGGNILPLVTKSSSEFDATQSTGKSNALNIGKAFKGADFDVEIRDSGDQVFIKSKTNPDLSVYIDSYQDGMVTLQKLKDVFGRNNVTNILEEAGFTGLKAPESLGSVTRVNYNPQDVRSRFARFDPEFAHLSNLSAANVSPIGGLLAQSGVSDKQAERIEEYLRRRGLLD